MKILETKSAPIYIVGARSKLRLLPAEMCERLIGLGHLMDFIALPDRISLPLVSIHDFRGERVSHGHARPGIREIDQPAQGQSRLPIRMRFHRHLVSCPTDTAGLDFEARFSVINRPL